LYWETGDVVDQPDRWEMTVGLVEAAPDRQCVVDVTPRRLQRFQPKPGTTVRWTNTSMADGRPIQTGEAVVDQHGLITLERVQIGKASSRLGIRP
jgi:hypothetical protein